MQQMRSTHWGRTVHTFCTAILLTIASITCWETTLISFVSVWYVSHPIQWITTLTTCQSLAGFTLACLYVP
ncbi:hypothetical protein DFH28DRAFT_470819 [Melampsora americana]|nr:hypothetical protein DFH28DRAFT_470819 [Melampsora americana]